MIKRKLVGVYGPNLKCTKPADCLTDRSANQTHPTRELMILCARDVTLTVDFRKTDDEDRPVNPCALDASKFVSSRATRRFQW